MSGKTRTPKPVQMGYETTHRRNKSAGLQAVSSKKYPPYIFWAVVFIVLFALFQCYGAYHFHYIEQEQLFLYTSSYLRSVWMQPAGLSRLLAEFGVQHFITPYVGSLIMSALFVCISVQTKGIIRRMAPRANLYPLCFLPAITLLFVHLDTNYFYFGTVAYSMMLMALYAYFGIENVALRALYAFLISTVLFWWAGSVAFLFVICVFLWESVVRFSQSYRFLFPLIWVTALAIGSVYYSWAGDYRHVLLPDGYFTLRLQPGVAIYLSWVCLPVILLVAALRRDARSEGNVLGWMLQIVVLALVFVYGMKMNLKPKAEFYKELNYYSRTEQWDKIIERCDGALTNYLYTCYLNMALAEKNELAERLFAFDQQGGDGLYLPWQRVSHVSVLLSNLYFSMGHVALSQRMAFEANVCTHGVGNPSMMKRLVQTNLISGDYPVAEKYIFLLEQTLYYKDWAQDQRRFLWNDEAIANDAVLGAKRKCTPDVNSIMLNTYVMEEDLKHIITQNPAHQATIQYLGAYYLLTKDVERFKTLIDAFRGTEALPDVLPTAFQEAVLILTEQNASYLDGFQIPEQTLRRYFSFRKAVSSNKNVANKLPQLLEADFGDTYWYYFMFKNRK